MVNEQYKPDNKHEGIPLVTQKARECLNPRQEVDYRELRRNLAQFLLNKAKDPDKINGYSDSVSITTMNRLDLLFRFVWEKEQRYTTKIDISHANSWCKHIAKRDDLFENT